MLPKAAVVLRLFLVLVSVLLTGPRLLAQQRPNLDLIFQIPFNFAPPGARATALGGTFIGLADDATAAAANPAGLTILVEPEVSAHLRFSRVELSQPGIFEDLQTSSERTTVPSFFSLVLPARRAAFSVFYQQEANFAANFREPSAGRLDLGPFDDPRDRLNFPGSVTFLYTEATEVVLDQIGFSGAVKLTPAVSVGGSIRFARADVQISTLGDFDQVSVRRFFPNYFSREFSVSGTDRDTTFNFGLLVKPTDQFSAGVVYRDGGEFTLPTRITETFVGQSDVESFTTRFAVPDSFGVGFAVRPTERLTFAVDIARVEYADLDEDLPNATEFHAGAEYVFLLGAGATPFSLRGGFFTDPDHDQFDDIDSKQVHGTFGFGFVLARRFQVDWAVNLSESIKESLLSFVVRF
jgi:long-subunit fatty acid transport protein